ncbi:hypothetical protein [Polaromonas sp. SM01]|uniref:hypothetical protein n=1 Tax=Polaromonas sp. SM01 TaxID=3085630 RepID=UPI002982174D|nr:hypothetical protein [Polaromonas sp. SM01]MDW5444023.1 hypothetical protein [Polaromonas sp. SM01]
MTNFTARIACYLLAGGITLLLQACAVKPPLTADWILVNSSEKNGAEPVPKQYALTRNANGDTLKIYAGNRGEAWLSFQPADKLAFTKIEERGLEYRIDDARPNQFFGNKFPNTVGLPSLLLSRHYPSESSTEVSLGTSSVSNGRTQALRQIIGGTTITLRYMTQDRNLASAKFSLVAAAEPIYTALGLMEAMQSGAVANRERYISLQDAASMQCRQSAVRQNWSDCMRDFNYCRTQNPVSADALSKCIELNSKRQSP